MLQNLKLNDQSKLILLSILLLIVILSYVIPNQYIKDSEEDISSQIETRLSIDEHLIENISKDLQETLLISGKGAYQQKALDYQKLYENQFAFFLYENDELDLWTDNHISVPAHFSEFKHEKFQKYGSYQVILNHSSFYQFDLVYLQIVMLDYPWQNEYLKNHLAEYFEIDREVQIISNEGSYVKDSSGKDLFRVQIKNKSSSKSGGLDFFLFLFGFYMLFQILSSLFAKWKSDNYILKTFVFTLILLFWYLMHLILNVPAQLFSSDLYSPSLYSFAWINNNLGNLFFISLIIFYSIVFYVRSKKARSYSVIYIYIFNTLIIAYLYFIISIIKSLVLDSQIIIDLYQLATLNFFSFLALWIVFIMQLSWILLAFRWMKHFSDQEKSEKHLWLSLVILGTIPLFFSGQFSFQLWFVQLMGSIGILLSYYLQSRSSQQRLMEVIVYLILFTFISALVLNDLNQQKERQFRETSAMNLNMENDPYLESHFISKIDQIKEDSILISFVRNNSIESVDDSLLNYISQQYFTSYLSIYNINLIHCDKQSQIRVFPEDVDVSCFDYFNDRINASKSIIKDNVLYLAEGDFQYRNYLGKISLSVDSVHHSCIFIEFVSKIKQQESGLPAILEKSHVFRSPMLRKYSYAFYKEGSLIDWRGIFDYKQKLSDYHLTSYHDSFFIKDEFQHYIYSNRPGNVLIISLEKPGLLQKLASFAFVFLFYSLLTFILFVLFRTKTLFSSITNFQGRLQYSMIILLLFSFILIGASSLYYIIFLNKEKNADSLLEKAHSVLIELEHKLASMDTFTENDKVYVESLLRKFSDVFFTDITLYTRDGKLLASSRSEVFHSDLLSKYMNANAYYQLNDLKNSFFIQNEQIGTQKYLSAYLPFRNQDNKSVAYLNLPYFAKQFELEYEVSGFIVAFLNIYLFLLFITILITILISRYLSRPLLLIKDKIRNLNLQQDNEKIEWNRDDELGDLVKEYNRMVDELEISAKKLVLTQRESAWREMAQQIAHEIKNPLTPMKLNVQYLEKAWDDRVEDYEDRMKRITKALKEQIDVLSEIAGQFSTFAVIEKTSPEFLDLKPVIENVIAVFKANESIVFINHFEDDLNNVFIDKTQIIRVLNNIYKNAVQALNKQDNPVIETIGKKNKNNVFIAIRDNGIGIPENEMSRIFEPRFTTKSSGMGLGLALVKKMLENSNASINVKSEEGIGTTFEIIIPITNQ